VRSLGAHIAFCKIPTDTANPSPAIASGCSERRVPDARARNHSKSGSGAALLEPLRIARARESAKCMLLAETPRSSAVSYGARPFARPNILCLIYSAARTAAA